MLSTSSKSRHSSAGLGTPAEEQYRPPLLIGVRVRAARLAAQQTQQQLAGATFSKSYISAVEHGKMTPSIQALTVLAARLGVPISQLLGVAPPAPAREPNQPTPEASEQTERLHEAERLMQEGRYEDAIVLFEEIGRPDRTSWAQVHYAQFLADQDRFRDAYEQMRRATQRSR